MENINTVSLIFVSFLMSYKLVLTLYVRLGADP